MMPQCKQFLASNCLTVVCILTAFFISIAAPAATFTVNSVIDANDINPNDTVCETQPGNGVCTLRAAIQQSNALPGADKINLPTGHYKIAESVSKPFKITDTLTIIGAGVSLSIVDGMKRNRVFLITPLTSNQNVSVVIQDISIQNGFSDSGLANSNGTIGNGGGLYSENITALDLRHLIIQNNQSNVAGAGIFVKCKNCKTTIQNSTIKNNGPIKIEQANNFGGGVSVESSDPNSECRIYRSTIDNNTAANGGGLFINNVNTTILDSSVTNNFAITDKVHLNSLSQGGGLSVMGAAGLNIVNSTISGNRSERISGGINTLSSGKLALYNATISNNSAMQKAGGINAAILNSIIVTSENSIIAGNSDNGTAPDCAIKENSFTSNGYNLIGDNTGCSFVSVTGDLVGTANTKMDPLLTVLSDNGGNTQTHALKPDSPAIDSANPNGCVDQNGTLLKTDQRGFAGVSKKNRARDGGRGLVRCDIGAYEVGITKPVADAGVDQTVAVNSIVTLDGSASLAMHGITDYSWMQLSGVNLTLSDPNSRKPFFTAPAQAASLTFRLTITDSIGQQNSAELYITVTESVTNTPAKGDTKKTTNTSNSSNGGCSMLTNAEFDPVFYLLFLLSFVRVWCRKTVELLRLKHDKPTLVCSNQFNS